MVRKKVGITLMPATIERLKDISEELGLTKSQTISLLINNYYIENNKKGDRNGEK